MSFDLIRQAIIDDTTNAWAKDQGYTPVYTVSATARLLIVGQAPGRKAQESRIPWNDVSGDTLRTWLGMSRETFYNPELVSLMPIDFFYPGKGASGDLPPRPEFAPKWHPQLLTLMPEIRLTLLVGQYAQRYYLGSQTKRTLTETAHAYEEYLPRFLPLVHPSPLTFRWRAQNPWFQAEVVPVLQKIIVEEVFQRQSVRQGLVQD